MSKELIKIEVTADFPGGDTLSGVVEEFENLIIDETLKACNGNKARAAKFLRMNRTTLVEKMRKRGLLVEKGGENYEQDQERKLRAKICEEV